MSEETWKEWNEGNEWVKMVRHMTRGQDWDLMLASVDHGVENVCLVQKHEVTLTNECTSGEARLGGIHAGMGQSGVSLEWSEPLTECRLPASISRWKQQDADASAERAR